MQIIIYYCILATNFFHPIHLSITNISHIEEKNQFAVSVRLFRDDLEMIINHKFNQNLSLTDNIITDEETVFVNKYINDMLVIMNNSDTLSADEIIVDIEEFMLVISFNLNIGDTMSSLEIRNTLMMDAFHDQKNLLIINYNEKEKGYNFTIDDYQQKIVL